MWLSSGSKIANRGNLTPITSLLGDGVKRFFTLLLTFSVVAGLGSPASGAGWSFPTPNSVPDGTTLVAVNEPNGFDAWSAWQATTGDMENYTARLCPNGIDSQNCDPEKAYVEANSILSVCKSAEETGCIESLRAQVSGSPWVDAKFIRGVQGQGYSARAQGAIDAGEISLWDIPGLTHGGGASSYAVIAKLRQGYNRGIQRFEAVALSANVSPFTIRPRAEAIQVAEGDANGVTRIFTRHDPVCIWQEPGSCGLVEEFPPNTRIEVSVRTPNSITGWFRGRLQSPDIKIDAISTASNRITVAGLVVTVPRVSVLANRAETPEDVAKVIAATGGKNALGPLFIGGSIRDFFSNEGERVFKVMDGLRNTAKDTSQGTSTLWNFTTIETRGSQPCFADKSAVLGVVTTNATAYLGDPPTFEAGSLNYKVAGMHYLPDGKTLSLGTYDLIMSGKVARCLYGFSSAPIQASIQVISDGGESTVATTEVTERDGWLKLAAYGFTFSEKNIQVKLSQFTPKNLTLPKFTGNAARLSKAQLASASSFAASIDGAASITCTGFFVRSSERSLASARAKETCRVISTQRPELTVVTGIKQTKQASSNSRVSVTAN